MINPIKIIIKALDDQEATTTMAIEDLFNGNDLFDVKCFTVPEDFLNSINELTDLVITDLRVDRFDAEVSIKDMVSKHRGIAIIVISAYFTVETLRSLIPCGINDTVVKEGNWLPHLYWAVMAQVPGILKKRAVLNLNPDDN